jgi:hypothetical protein
MILGFQRKENFIFDPIVLMIRDLRRRGLLLGSTEEILERAKAHPRRIIVVGTEEYAKSPVLVDLGYSQNYGDGGERALSQPGMAAKIQELCQIAGVTGDLRGFGAHALRRGAASDLSRVPGDTWRAGASDHVSYVLGHPGGGNGLNKLAERYADTATEDASRARESDLPLQPGDDDGTTWTRIGSHPLEMVKTMRELDAMRDLDASEVLLLTTPTPADLDPAAPTEQALEITADPLLLHLFNLSHDELCDTLTNEDFGSWFKREARNWVPFRSKEYKYKGKSRRVSKESRRKKNEKQRQARANLKAQGVLKPGPQVTEESRRKSTERKRAWRAGLTNNASAASRRPEPALPSSDTRSTLHWQWLATFPSSHVRSELP